MSVRYASLASNVALTLTQHALNEVPAIIHDHSISLIAVLTGHRLDLHALHNRLLGELACRNLLQCAHTEDAHGVGHLLKLAIYSLWTVVAFV